jgi:hypothetical protein
MFVCEGGSFYRIVAAPGKGMAPYYPPHRQKSTPDGTVFGDGFNRILGTGRNKTASRRKKGGNKVLIPSEYRYQAYSR